MRPTRRHRRSKIPSERSLQATEVCESRQLLSAISAPIDGVGNNQLTPWWGSTHTELMRLAPAEYADGISQPAGASRPSARTISNAVVAQAQNTSNARHLTDYAWMWGQFLDHDLDLSEAKAPAENFHVAVASGDRWFDPYSTGAAKIELTRSDYVIGAGSSDGQRQQMNTLTAFLDGSVLYGADAVRAAALRSYQGGKLKTSAGDLLPWNDAGLPNAGGSSNSLFLAGDVRANENIALTSMHTLWMREHNRIADELATRNPQWNDQQLYEQARAIVAAEIQAITYNEFLPALLGSTALAPYAGYDPSVNPTIANEFSTAAYRFGHSLLSPQLQRLDATGNSISAGPISLSAAFFRPAELVATGIDPLLRGAAVQVAQELDVQIVDDVRNFLFGPPGAGGLDLASLNIQRGRDHGLADYNATRVALGLPKLTSFSQITSSSQLAAALESAYGNVDEIDLWVGGLAEDHLSGSSMGLTFTTILVNQFQRLRDGDRFWYENVFSGPQLTALRKTRLSDVIQRNTAVCDLQTNVFFAAGSEVVEIRMAPLGITKATVRAVNGRVEVVDDVNNRVLLSRRANDIGGLIVVGNERVADRLIVDASVTPAMLPQGVHFRAGNVGRDRLMVRGTAQADCMTVDGQRVDVNGLDVLFENIDELLLEGGDGNDQLTVLHPCVNRMILDGGAGDDILLGGDGPEEMYGGPGNDILRGGDGDDTLNGGPGGDQLYGEGGRDRLYGNGGFDLLVQDGDECSPEVQPRYADFLDRFYNLRTMPNDFYNWGKRQERWFYSNLGWMFITPDGTIRLWDRQPGAQGRVIATVSPQFHNNLTALCDHTVPFVDEDAADALVGMARELDRQLELRFWGSYIYNWGGRQEKWIPGKSGWYCITRDGRLYRWDGSRNAEGTLIAELDIMYYSRPELLHNAW